LTPRSRGLVSILAAAANASFFILFTHILA
jgi:hypothetical protein